MPALRLSHLRFLLAPAVLALVSVVLAAPADAQMAGPGNSMGVPGPINSTAGLHNPVEEQQIAPPALPGASAAGNISAGPVNEAGEDPTALLFSAINHGDYAQARAAVSRGANLDARNALDETPIELAVELNRNNITFMLLSVRAEEGGGSGAAGQGTEPLPPTKSGPKAPRAMHFAASPRRVIPASTPSIPVAPASNQPGVPDPAAGFLGFGGKS